MDDEAPEQNRSQASVPAKLQERLAQAEKKAQVATDVATGSHADAQRAWIAKTIIWILVGSVAACMILMGVEGYVSRDWSQAAGEATDLVKSTILPIVTLVLGYYFGQGSKS